jgi:hypothetical protein
VNGEEREFACREGGGDIASFVTKTAFVISKITFILSALLLSIYY